MHTLFSTAGINPERRFRAWRAMIFERIVPVEQRLIDDQPFEGMLEVADVPGLAITRVTQGALRTEATPQTIRRHDKHETLSVTIKLAGVTSSIQGGREAVQRAGDIVVLDREPMVMTSSMGSQSLFLEVPRARLESMLGPTRLYTALSIEGGRASASLAGRFFAELLRVHGRLAPDTASRMASVGVDLLVASIADRMAQDVPRALYGTVVVQRAKAYAEAHLGDPSLDPPRLAAAAGVSLRRLQALFQERGRQVSDWIWTRRLEVAALRLADPAQGHVSIGTLAYGCGFASQAHFSRRFKDRFGMTPSEFRQAARADFTP